MSDGPYPQSPNSETEPLHEAIRQIDSVMGTPVLPRGSAVWIVTKRARDELWRVIEAVEGDDAAF